MLRLGPLNFAGQLDGPYLLGAAGTEIAQTLGSLTNVSMLFRAAVEAGRVRKGAERDAKGAEGRLEALARAAAGVDRRPAGGRHRAGRGRPWPRWLGWRRLAGCSR